MTAEAISGPPSGGEAVRLALYRSLSTGTPAQRLAILLGIVEECPGTPVELPSFRGMPAILDGIELGQVTRRTGNRSSSRTERLAPLISLRGANLQGVHLRNARLAGLDLRGANLRDAALGGADLRGASMEGADLQGADLAGTNLEGASLGSVNFANAMLEEAKLRKAGLRFARLDNATLENADLRRADLWGAHVAGATLEHADLRHSTLRESDFQGANLSYADLRGTLCTATNFSDAIFVGAQLQGLDLTTAHLSRIRLCGAWLDKTYLGRHQIGGPIGEELVGDYVAARKGYLALERAFQDFGDHDDASWAYRRRRRMQKKATWQRSQNLTWQTPGRKIFATLHWAGDQIVEWLCDYGESIPRVLISLMGLYLAFTLLYGVTGSVVKVVETSHGLSRVVTRNPLDLAVFSLLAISTSGSPSVGLLPSSESVHFLTALEALLGIAITGLLGFVLGNRIRR